MSKNISPKAGQPLLGWFDYHWIIYDVEVKGNIFEWGVKCVDYLKLVPINMWTQYLKRNLKVMEISRAEFYLKQLQEEKFNVRENSPLTLKNPTDTKNPPNTRKRYKLHGVNNPSIKQYFKVVNTTKNNTPKYSYKNKKS